MSTNAYFVGGKLKLKGKPLDVKGGGAKKKKRKESIEQKLLQLKEKEDAQESQSKEETGSPHESDGEQEGRDESRTATYEDHRTPAEKTYDDQRTRLEMKRLAKVASKSHRQKIEEFNQYLANLSEHYDIPKVQFSATGRGQQLHLRAVYSQVIQESGQGVWHIPKSGVNDIVTPREWLRVTPSGIFRKYPSADSTPKATFVENVKAISHEMENYQVNPSRSSEALMGLVKHLVQEIRIAVSFNHPSQKRLPDTTLPR